MLDKWTEELESGGQINMIYTDYEKAFDKVPHRRLINKVASFGLLTKISEWIKAFLSDRQYKVRINSKFLRWYSVQSGIPQGSVLGPLLFIMYVNDLPDICTSDTDLYLFAGDAKNCKYIRNEENQAELQTTLRNMQNWSDTWLLKLNVHVIWQACR